MTGDVLLDRVAVAGAAASLDPDGRVRIAGASRLPAGLLDLLRQNRAEVAAALATRRGGVLAEYEQAATAAAVALAAPDPDLTHERAEIAAAQAAEARGGHGQAPAEVDHHATVAGLVTVARQRPSAWSDVAAHPPGGAWCSRCGRMRKSGGRWWREAEAPRGWRCATCHPPNPGAAVVEVET